MKQWKGLLLIMTLCLAVSVCTGSGEEEHHWPKRLRRSAQNPNGAEGSIRAELADFLKIAKASYTKLQQRSRYNTLNSTNTDTPENIRKSLIYMMARRRDNNEGPDALWNKFKAQSKTNGQAQPFSAVVDLAVEGVTKFIEEYLKELKVVCENVGSHLTKQMNASQEQKIAEIIATDKKVHKCLKLQEELLGPNIAISIRADEIQNEDGLIIEPGEFVTSAIVHNATLLSRRYTERAAYMARLAVEGENRIPCFYKFYHLIHSLGQEIVKTEDISNEILALIGIQQRTNDYVPVVTEPKNVHLAYWKLTSTNYVEDSYVQGRGLSEYIAQLHPKNGTECGKNIIRSVAEAAVELDLQNSTPDARASWFQFIYEIIPESREIPSL